MSAAAHSCDIVRLSVFVDGELPRDEANQLVEHVRHCVPCREAVRDLQTMRAAVVRTTCREPASRALGRRVMRRLRGVERVRRRQIAIAAGATCANVAVVLLALAAGMMVAGRAGRQELAPRLDPPPRSLAIGDYVAETALGSPERFWRRFEAIEAISLSDSTLLDFQPTIPEVLPGGFRLERIRLLKDVCCYTVQARYVSPSGVLDVFQCHDDHPVSYGAAQLNAERVANIAYTSLTWSGAGLRGRAFRRGDLSIVVVGDLARSTADQLTMELSNVTG